MKPHCGDRNKIEIPKKQFAATHIRYSTVVNRGSVKNITQDLNVQTEFDAIFQATLRQRTHPSTLLRLY